MLKQLLQGRPIKHPIHPILVHYPTGLWVLSLLLDLATLLLGGNPPLVHAAYYTMLAGTVMAVIATIPGFTDWYEIRKDHAAKKTATIHMVLNLAAIAIYAVNLLLRAGDLDRPQVSTLPFVLSLVGVGILSLSGYLGGMIVYDDGVGVGRHRRSTNLPDSTVRVKSGEAGATGDYVEVGNASDLSEGETMRAEINGNVMTIANVEGKLYAFQEFCTHRYGPLSEGAFYDHQVECPWHRSCFDIRTGKVTKGPAKVDIKTYEVDVQNGKIRVRVPNETYPGEATIA